MSNKDKIKRHFTVMADYFQKDYLEMLTLSVKDLENMSYEWVDAYAAIV